MIWAPLWDAFAVLGMFVSACTLLFVLAFIWLLQVKPWIASRWPRVVEAMPVVLVARDPGDETDPVEPTPRFRTSIGFPAKGVGLAVRNSCWWRLAALRVRCPNEAPRDGGLRGGAAE